MRGEVGGRLAGGRLGGCGFAGLGTSLGWRVGFWLSGHLPFFLHTLVYHGKNAVRFFPLILDKFEGNPKEVADQGCRSGGATERGLRCFKLLLVHIRPLDLL